MNSPVTLSFSSVFSLLGSILIIIAFGTNNWQEFRVNRAAILKKYNQDPETRLALVMINQTDIYFSRTFGFFRECFPSEVPNGAGTYTDPLGSQCRNIQDYQIPEDSTVVSNYGYYQLIRMHMMRTCVALYIVGIVFLSICLTSGIRGCWRRNSSLIMVTGILMLFSALFIIASIAIWHGIDYIQRELIDVMPFYKRWPTILNQYTDISYGWSYMVAWIGVGFILISSISMLVAQKKMKDEERRETEGKPLPYMMPAYHEKIMMVPYNQSMYGYPHPMYSYGAPTMANSYYGYLTYGH
ncbi:hypothetical protein T4B_2254 [Trichinella pseudospiralis]|uniref:Claudin domain-containing protein 1 n=3 Tax=Trichinella TaxID=6333 RepID=A0A0V1EXF0_TRIPS|nr:hypothetical protein T4E_1625 [Trichinella pseudospiralis]KRY78462.1 hypothetical protein T4A_5357 [Trichinella pseudospiralis]KRZ18332.1 hypothetical protein T11_4925 [Trichinella zimbabwensis]KRZ34066.1 hypothetical protein T4B_2254 [Trichinella pseudospiralis]KRZ44941.1 hypothetical protein T4C_1519 [Trichinella pseudospiralis]